MGVAQDNERTVRERRVALGLSLRDLGDMTGLDAATLSRYENGYRVRPSVRRLVAAALDFPEKFVPPERT